MPGTPVPRAVLLPLVLCFAVSLSAAPPASDPSVSENFDHSPVDSLPTGWTQWSSSGAKIFAVSSQAATPPHCLTARVAAGTGVEARAWLEAPQAANVAVSADVFFNSSTPAEIIARGNALDTAKPSCYAVSATYGSIGLKLLRIEEGRASVMGELRANSGTWFSSKFARVTLFVNGGNVRVQVRRADTSQYLNAFGQWQAGEAWAINVQDPTPLSGVLAGVGRLPGQASTTSFNNFACTSLHQESRPPVVAIDAPQNGTGLSGVARIVAKTNVHAEPASVQFYVDDVLRAAVNAPPYAWNFDTTEVADGPHKLKLLAYDALQNVSLPASVEFGVTNNFPATSLPPETPRHYSHIRLAQVAYGGPPFNAANVPLLRSSVDLVITNPDYAATMHAEAPATPKFIYTNVSSLYLDLLADWLNYADAHKYRREEPFYHVTAATPYSGAGGSTQPIDWFWQVWTGGDTLTDQTRAAHDDRVTLPGEGESLIVGHLDRFREINFTLASGASAGWSCALEYPSAIDAAGKPTAWTKLTPLADTSSGLKQSGRITFDPPTDWKPAALGGDARLFYVRLRTATAGTAPVATAILGRDYVGAHGRNSYVIPAFDYSADADHDGYLNDAEYARRQPGMDARFVYESRLLSYGQMRFSTSPSEAGYRNWCVDYHVRYIGRCPQAAGLFMDNSDGRASAAAGSVLEPVGAYAGDYGTLMRRIEKAIAPRWMIANTAGWSGDSVDSTLQAIQGYYEEFAMRPEADTYQRFESLAEMVAKRAKLVPSHYAILDSYPSGGSQTDPRTLMGTLAYYYLLTDPKTTFLDYWGGGDPSGPWSKHWTPAVAYDIGQPKGAWSLFDSGKDPANAALVYRVYGRSFERALVLYKPLSYTKGVTGTLTDATVTSVSLKGSYRPLRADATLGEPATSISLRNGEGAIMIGP